MANTIRLLSTLALMGAVRNVAEKYEAVTGARIEADFAPTLALLDRLRRGRPAMCSFSLRRGSLDLSRGEKWSPKAVSILRDPLSGLR